MKILVIEAEAIIAFEIQMRLEQKGYDVRIESTAENALKSLTDYKPDLILTAIIIGGEMDGIEFAGIIQREKNIPIVYLTALDYLKNNARLLETQPVAVLSKPYSDWELFEAIEKALETG